MFIYYIDLYKEYNYRLSAKLVMQKAVSTSSIN